jgi:ABC-2 type transport system permease protein
MSKNPSSRMYTLVARELQEYRLSLLITPVAIAAALTVIMLASVLLADRISFVGEVVMNSLVSAQGSKQMMVTIQFDEDSADADHQYSIREQEEPIADEEWNFSREWNFNPERKPDPTKEDDDSDTPGALNPMFNIMHSFMVLVLVAVTINYLLGSLFHDRKDRSILFWKSMPVSDWEQVGAKLLVALIAAPLIYIAASFFSQLTTTLLSMLLVWRLDMAPVATILGNIDVLPLLVNPLAGWAITALWIAPLYAWLMLASAGARRSPFMFAVAPVIGLVVLEQIFLGSDFVGTAVSQHVPHYAGPDDAVGFYFNGREWARIDVLKIGSGILFAAAAIWITVWLRRYRFEL